MIAATPSSNRTTGGRLRESAGAAGTRPSATGSCPPLLPHARPLEPLLLVVYPHLGEPSVQVIPPRLGQAPHGKVLWQRRAVLCEAGEGVRLVLGVRGPLFNLPSLHLHPTWEFRRNQSRPRVGRISLNNPFPMNFGIKTTSTYIEPPPALNLWGENLESKYPIWIR